jgi:hypothetical protein
MTGTQQSNANTLLKHQFYFVKEHLHTLPPYFFILQLDTPLSEDNPTMTLRRRDVKAQRILVNMIPESYIASVMTPLNGLPAQSCLFIRT